MATGGESPEKSGDGLPRQRKAKSRERWELVLEVSTKLFQERGFAGTSMQDISDRVGLKKGSLYYYVDSKEQLLFEILKDLHHGGEALVASVNFKTSDPLGELRSYFVQMGIYAAKHADRLEIFSRDFDFLTPEQQRRIISERRMYWDAVVKLIVLAVEQGQVSAEIDVRSAAQAILRSVTSISQWYRPSGTLPIEQLAVQTAALMVNGLRGIYRD